MQGFVTRVDEPAGGEFHDLRRSLPRFNIMRRAVFSVVEEVERRQLDVAYGLTPVLSPQN